jgi:hypothetical protein
MLVPFSLNNFNFINFWRGVRCHLVKLLYILKIYFFATCVWTCIAGLVYRKHVFIVTHIYEGACKIVHRFIHRALIISINCNVLTYVPSDYGKSSLSPDYRIKEQSNFCLVQNRPVWLWWCRMSRWKGGGDHITRMAPKAFLVQTTYSRWAIIHCAKLRNVKNIVRCSQRFLFPLLKSYCHSEALKYS